MKREDKDIQERAVIQHTEGQLTIAILCPIILSLEVPEKRTHLTFIMLKNSVQSHLFTVNWDIIIRNDISLS